MLKHPHVWIMSDDMYEHLVFDGFEHATIAQVAPELRDRTLTVSGASKTYAMTGWRIGFAGGPKDLIKAMVNMQGQATAGVSTVGQAAAVAALNGPQDGVREQMRRLSRRRDMAVEMLNACHGINCHKPEGAFYVFPNVAGCIGKTTAGGRRLETDQDVCMALLEEEHVATVHGAAYGMSPYLRISTATDDDVAGRGLPAHQGILRRAALTTHEGRAARHRVRYERCGSVVVPLGDASGAEGHSVSAVPASQKVTATVLCATPMSQRA